MTYEERKEKKLANHRAWYRRVMADPDRYARYREARNRHYAEHKEVIRAYLRQWRKSHKRRMKMQRRLEADRRRMLCRESPEFYQHRLEIERRSAAKSRRRSGKVTCAYVPQTNRRTPLGCTFGRVLDTRSVFLWNNLPAASLVAGRAYRAMQWRETHCDRFGRVCR